MKRGRGDVESKTTATCMNGVTSNVPFPRFLEGAHSIVYICRTCLMRFSSPRSLTHHEACCVPPLASVAAAQGNIVVYAWDGRFPSHTHACWNAATLGSLFLEHKFVVEDVHLFTFYVAYNVENGRSHFCGFFSKEHSRASACEHSLACIFVYPSCQGQGVGTLLVHISYAFTLRENRRGTPERPLSQNGQRLFSKIWQHIVTKHMISSSCTSIEDCCASTGMVADDVLGVLHSMRCVVTTRCVKHPLVVAPGRVASNDHKTEDRLLIWP